MKILVINSGSSSLKYQLFEMENEKVLSSGLIEKIGEEISIITHKVNQEKTKFEKPILNHTKAIETMISLLTSTEFGVIQDKTEIHAIGHRVVHGGEQFKEPTLIDEKTIKSIQAHEHLAPLHNPANLTGILACKDFFGNVPQVAVFDTAFHQTIPSRAYLYAIDYSLYKENGVRRYGFHGTSHKYVASRGALFLKKDLNETNLITIHLGNGSSITAIEKGKSIDTTMGMTPLEGIVMGTRSGDIDPGIIFFLHRTLGKKINEIDDLLNKKSGLKGLVGTNDMRDLLSKKESGDRQAELAFEVYTYRIKKYIGAYFAVLGKVDGIIFTGGIGENSIDVRREVCKGLEFLGIKLDESLNQITDSNERRISTIDSKVEILIIPTNEELQIARETKAILF